MALIFYPHLEDAQRGSLEERIEHLMEAAERFKAVVLDDASKSVEIKRLVPRDQTAAYNWEEIARVLREIRELSEVSKQDKTRKGILLTKLSEVYEVLRAAKMSKLEAVRLALINEASHLKG
jgi:LPS sulfotransferase NodH